MRPLVEYNAAELLYIVDVLTLEGRCIEAFNTAFEWLEMCGGRFTKMRNQIQKRINNMMCKCIIERDEDMASRLYHEFSDRMDAFGMKWQGEYLELIRPLTEGQHVEKRESKPQEQLA